MDAEAEPVCIQSWAGEVLAWQEHQGQPLSGAPAGQ